MHPAADTPLDAGKRLRVLSAADHRPDLGGKAAAGPGGLALPENLPAESGRGHGGSAAMIYLDHGATSFPKPAPVAAAVNRALFTRMLIIRNLFMFNKGQIKDLACLTIQCYYDTRITPPISSI